MTKKTVILQDLKAYFDSKGGFMEMNEYKDAVDAPIRFQNIKRVFGSWNRLKAILGYKEVEIAPVAAPKSAPATEPVPAPEPVTAPEQVPAPEPVQEPAPVEEPAPVQEQPAPVATKPVAKK